jgi:hypothetical protein
MDLNNLKLQTIGTVKDVRFLDHLSQKLELILKELPKGNIVEIVKNNEDLFHDIADTHCAMVFRQNMNNELTPIKNSFDDGKILCNQINVLNIPNNDFKDTLESLEQNIVRLTAPSIVRSEDILSAFRDVQTDAAKIRTMMGDIYKRIERCWQTKQFFNKSIKIIVPRVCSTDTTRYGAIFIDWNSLQLESVSFSLEGSLIVVSPNGLIKISRPEKSNVTSYGFHFVGSSSGKGALVIRSDKPDDFSSGIPFTVQILPTTLHLLRDSSFWSAPLAGFVLFVLWQMNIDIKFAAPMSVAVGAILGFIIFLMRSFRREIEQRALF